MVSSTLCYISLKGGKKMRFKKIFGVIALTIMLVLSVASSAFAEETCPNGGVDNWFYEIK